MKAKLVRIAISMLLVLGVGMLAVPVPTQSASLAEITLDPTPVEVETGEPFEVTLKIEGIPEPGMAGYDFWITFTPGVIQFATSVGDHEWPDPNYGTPFVFTVDNVAGRISFNDIYTAIPAPSGDITLAVLHGTAIATESVSTDLHFDKSDIKDPDGEDIPATVTDGEVQVQVKYALSMAPNPPEGGTATDVTDDSPYAEGDEIEIEAEAEEGWQFVNWTAPAGTFEDANQAATTFTMPDQAVTVTANFEPITYELTMAVTPPGSGTATDVTDDSPYAEGDEVEIEAEAEEGWQFVNWTAPAGTFEDANQAATTFIMPDQAVTVTANFEETETECVQTATGTGMACFTPSRGTIEELEALLEIPPDPPEGVEFPHGMFSFKVTGLDVGQTVTIEIKLPDPIPAGFVWWKEHEGEWYDLPIATTLEPNVIKLTLTDGVFPGDLDGVADGTITDPGGPGNPAPGPPPPLAPTAGPVYPIWAVLLAGIIAGASLLVLRRRRAQI